MDMEMNTFRDHLLFRAMRNAVPRLSSGARHPKTSSAVISTNSNFQGCNAVVYSHYRLTSNHVV